MKKQVRLSPEDAIQARDLHPFVVQEIGLCAQFTPAMRLCPSWCRTVVGTCDTPCDHLTDVVAFPSALVTLWAFEEVYLTRKHHPKHDRGCARDYGIIVKQALQGRSARRFRGV